MRRNGFTLPELLISIAIAGMVLATALPAMRNALRDARLDSATNELVSDLRQARSRAVMTGWDHRIVGFDATSMNNANSYRIFSRQSTAIGWPADTAGAFTSATATAGEWKDIGGLFPGIVLAAASPSRFELTFDARGGVVGAAANFNSLNLSQPDGRNRSVTVSIVGSVIVE